MRSRAALSLLACTAVLAGCGDGETETVTIRETVTETVSGTVPNEAPARVTLYFLSGGKVAPEVRELASRPDIATATMEELFEGSESGDLTTAIPSDIRLLRLTIARGGLASIATTPRLTTREQQAQVVYTLTQFDTVERVVFDGGRPVERASYEDQTPAIFVQSPLPGEEVEPGFAATGTANTFEATFQYELRDAGDRVLSDNFVTATSGSGTRGTFRFTVPYEVGTPQRGRLVVFEISAASGSRTNERSIPLRLR